MDTQHKITISLSLFKNPPGRILFSSANLLAILRKYVTMLKNNKHLNKMEFSYVPFSSENWLGFHSSASLAVSGSN